MKVNGDAIAECVLSIFDALPVKAKPRHRQQGEREWVPLSGIVLYDESDQTFNCVALGTGMRCLPAAKLPLANGRCLHDWHAEIIALRAFNLFLIQECTKLSMSNNASSSFVKRVSKDDMTGLEFQPFVLNECVRIFMYSSEAPCGDASMELTIRSQADPIPWSSPIVPEQDVKVDQLEGRGHFSALGTVRRKPSRGDAPLTLSKSCSDKLALKQCTSLLSSPTSVLIRPSSAYLTSLIIPENQHIEAATVRAFSANGRMGILCADDDTITSWRGGYGFHPLKIETTRREFDFSRRAGSSTDKVMGSNISAMWTPQNCEVLIGGRIQGHTKQSPGGASSISRYGLWKSVVNVIGALDIAELSPVIVAHEYGAIKSLSLLESRRQVKEDVRRGALCHWFKNRGDDTFGLDEKTVRIDSLGCKPQTAQSYNA